MRWEKLRRSQNVEDRRGRRVPGGRPVAMGGGGIGMLLLMLLLAFVFKVNPLELMSQTGGPAPQQQAPQGRAADPNDEMGLYVSKVLGSTEDEWTQIFRQYGRTYRPAKLVNFSGATPMPGGLAQSATGPFYLPANQTIYLDTSFFQQLRGMARDRSQDYDFAPAYVIAHEVGHHVQHLLGYTDKVHSQRGRVPKRIYNQLSVRLELQADFLAGVWAHHADRRMQRDQGVKLLEEGDIEEAMRAAKAIGDDALQRSSGGHIRPESFTHGTSEQRLKWFMQGYRSGDPNQGNTFDVPYERL